MIKSALFCIRESGGQHDDIMSGNIREFRDDEKKRVRLFEIQRSPSEGIRLAAPGEPPVGSVYI